VLLLVLSFAIGEAVALAIAANRKSVITSSWWLAFVVASLAVVSILIVVSALRRPARAPDAKRSTASSKDA